MGVEEGYLPPYNRMMIFEKFADSSYRKFENTLTIHITNAPAPLNWAAKPRQLIWALARNKYLLQSKTKRSIGHVTVEINYTDDSGNKIQRFGGQGAVDLSQFAKKLIKEGYAFSIILGPRHHQQYPELKDRPLQTIDGRFESREELVLELDENIYKDNLVATVSYVLAEDKMKEAIKFFDDYESHTKKAQEDKSYPYKAATRYGFGADTLKFEGAGCATFVEAFYEVVDLSDQYKSFFQDVNVPLKFFGNPENGHKVSLPHLLFTNVDLGTKSSDSLNISFPDPNLMFEKLKIFYESQSDSFDHLKLLEKGKIGDSKSFYLVFDARA